MSTQYFKLKTLSPVHIGSGEKYSNLDYFTDGNILHFIDLDRFINYLEAKDESWVYDFSEKVSQPHFELSTFIKEKGIKRDEYSLFVSKTLQGNQNAKDINKHILSGGKAFIPGSTLKGVIKNAIMYCIIKHDSEMIKFVNDIINNPKKNTYDQLKDRIYGNKNKYIVGFEDILKKNMHCLKVSDSIPIANNNIMSVKEFSRENTSLSKKTIFSEVINQNEEIGVVEITVDTIRLDKMNNKYSKYIKNWNICLNSFISDVLKKERKIYLDENKSKINKLKGNKTIIAFIDKLLNKDNIIRVGKENGMLFHSIISLLIKDRDESLLGYLLDDDDFKKNILPFVKHIVDKITGKIKKKLYYSSMYPKSRSITVDNELFGFIEMIKIEKDEYENTYIQSNITDVSSISNKLSEIKENAIKEVEQKLKEEQQKNKRAQKESFKRLIDSITDLRANNIDSFIDKLQTLEGEQQIQFAKAMKQKIESSFKKKWFKQKPARQNKLDFINSLL